ncbi:MAG: diaminopimelate epimerase [Spirochaetales bacterium]|nr:diaminopimelate epimerase [Spirochaetales bacterium]
MDLEFIKLQSAGSDFIVVDTFKNTILRPDQLPGMAARITNRHFGVGAVSLALILAGEEGRLRVMCYGGDGEECRPDPLALRCVARYAFDAGLVNSETFSLEAGELRHSVEVIDSLNVMVRSGPPYHWDAQRVLKERVGEQVTRAVSMADRELRFTPVYVGGQHAVFLAGEATGELQQLAQTLESSQLLPTGPNISIVRVISREEMSLRTWQAGRGETYASENAACASVVATVINGFTDREVQVHCEGGNLFVEWAENDNLFYTSGPAEYVFMGTYYYEEAESP